MDSRGERRVDRISKLPYELIWKILSLLPTKYVVGTSVLSRRWQNMWASVPSLDLNNSLYFKKSTFRQGKSSADLRFMNFVDRVIFLTDVSSLKSFCLQYYYISDKFRVNTWIYTALKRNVTEMKLCYFADSPISLPSKIFESKTLVVLNLENAIRVEVPDSVLLPSLKILHLLNIMKYKDEESNQKLFSGCPVLEELYLQLRESDIRITLEISVPTLKHLRLKNYRDPASLSATAFLLQINAPKLEHLDIIDNVAGDIYFEDLSSVSKARIDLSGGAIVIPKLFEGIEGVKSLYLCERTLSTYEYSADLPTLQNLIHLEIEAVADYCWYMLAELLAISPNLEVLILHKRAFRSYYNKYEAECSWDEPLALEESNLLLHLKEVEVGEFNGYKFEIDAIAFILRNAIVLKTMTIDCQSPNIKTDMRKTLTGLPRASKDFQLNLFL